jgi:hypothetical protein
MPGSEEETPEGDPQEGDQPPPAEGEGGEQQPPPEGGEEGAPPEGEGADPNADPNAPSEGEPAGPDGPNVEEPEDKSEARNVANDILLLRSFNRLHSDIRKFSKRVADSKHQSMLASVTYKQVIANLEELRDMVYKYILLSYDSSTYDQNKFNYEYFIEIMHWNLAMLEKVNEIVEKAESKKKSKNK